MDAIARAKHAAYVRQWNAKNIDKRRAQNRASRARNAAHARAKRIADYRANPHRDWARKAVFTAIANDSLVRPDNCSGCGRECKPDGHHYLGYEEQNWLKVQWLCRWCHRKADANAL